MPTKSLRRFSRTTARLLTLALAVGFLSAAGAKVAAAQQPDLVLNMTGSPDPVAAGGVVAYSISVLNDGPTSTATGVTVTMPVPAGASYSGFSGTGVACGGMTVGAAGPGTIVCTLPNLAYLDVSNLTVSLKTSTSGPFPITATAAENETDLDLSNNSITVTTTVVAGADIAFSISAPASIGSGSAMSYTLNLHNLGPDAATNLSVQFPIPTGFVFTGSNPSGCTLSAGTLSCTVAGPIASGSTVNIGPISGQVSAANTSTITASGSETVTGGGTADPNAANSNGTLNTTVTAGSDVSVSISRSASAPFFVGSSFNFQITAKYTGDSPNGLTITDVVPANYTIGSVTASQQGWTCGVAGQTVTCTKATGGVAGSNQSLTGVGQILIPVTMNTTGLVTNTVTITSTSPVDPDNTNNSANDGGANILTPTADLSISISGPSPALVVTGQSFTETSTVSNGGPSLFYGLITMTTQFPAGVTVASYVQNGWACSPAAQAGPVSIVCTRTYTSGSPLASGSNTPSVVWTLFTTGTGSIATTGGITTTGANVSDPNTGNDNVNFSVGSSTGPNSADISINKTVDLASVNAGDVLTYTLEVVNNAPVQASTNISISDNLTTLINSSTGATGAGFVSAVATANIAGSASCSAPSVTGGTSVTLNCTIPNLPPCTTLVNCPTFVVQIRPGGDGGARSNTANIVSSSIADPNLANNSATASNTVVPRADITVSINGTPNPVAAGQPLTYVITATDNGPSLAQNVTVVDALPIGTIFLSAAPSSGTCGTTPVVGATVTALNQFVTCNLGTINNGAQRTVTVKVTPANALQGSNTVTNSVGVTTTTTEPSPILQTNNQASVTGSVSVPSLDLTISNTDSPDPVTVGDVMAYTITVHNIGPSDAENVVITDNLPSALISYASVSFPGGTCGTTPTAGSFGGTVVCNVVRLTAGSTVVLTINMTGAVKGVTSNTATVASDETSHGWENAANNTAVQNTTVRTRTDIQLLSKVASAPTGFRRPFTWTIAVSNPTGAGLAEADTVKVNDALPAGMELTATPTAALVGGTTTTINACTGSAGSTTFICSFGTMSSGGEADITVPVRMITFPAGGATTNTATVTTSSQDINAGNNSASGIATILGSSISGNVYRDFNTNGVQDAGDTGIQSIVMTLSGHAWDGSAVSVSVNSDASGNWSFTNLPESDATGYTVARGTVATTLLVNGPTAVGDHAGTASVAGGLPQVAGIVLAQNDAAINYHFSMVPQARIGLAKTITGSPTVSVSDGSYTIPVKILIQNYSQEQLDGIVINDPLAGAAPSFGTFVAGGAGAVLAQSQYTINAAPSVISGTCGTATLNAAFDGSGTVKVADMSTLAVATSCTLGFTIRWQPVIPLPGGGYSNQANATGTGHLSGQAVSDLSQNGTNPDPDSDGDPTNNSAVTPITPALVADVTTSLSFPATVNAGLAVGGSVLFKNTGPYTGSGMTYGLTLSANLAGVTFGNLPGGATATYTVGTGVIVFTGMPTTLTLNQIASGDGLTGITVAYTQNATASSTVHSTIGTSTSQGTNTNVDVANATVGGILIADVTTSMTFPALVNAGQPVIGRVVFKNTGPSVASGLTYSITLSSGLTGVSFANLPAGATAAYVSGTGVITLGSMPATATLNQILSADGVNGIQVTYTQNATASSTVASTIATTTNEGTNTNVNSANASVGGSLIADVTTTLTFPVVANAGDPIAGTIVFTNNGPSIASGVTYTLTATANLPGVSFGNLPGGATATYVAGTGVITLTGMPATLNAAQIASGNGTSGITMNYTQNAVGVSQINSGIGTTTSQGANAAVDAAVANPGGGLVADVTTIASFPASVNAGQPVSGTILWKNNGPSIASGVTYALTLNAGLSGVSFSNLPAGATATYVSGTGIVTLTGMPAVVAIGATVSGDGVAGVTVNYTQNALASTTVTGTIGTTTSEGANIAPNIGTGVVGGALIADVTTTMTFPALVNAGQPVVGRVVFKNTGPSVASGLSYTLTLNTGLTGVSFANLPAGATASYASGTGVVTFGSMPATAALNQILSADGVNGVQVTYTQNALATSAIASTIATTTNEGANANGNSANAAVAGALIADVTTTLTFPVVANAGVPIAGTIVFTNNGPSVASGVTYTLSATVNLVGVAFGNLPAGATATYTAATGIVTLAGMPATLAAGQIVSGNGTTGITMNYTQTSTGVSQINSGIGTTTSQGANAALDAAVASPGGGLIADMTTIETFPAVISAGQPVTGTVVWKNNGPSIASGVTYTLTLNARLAGVSFSNLPAGATATYVPGTGVVTLTGMPATVAIGAIVSGDGATGIVVNYTQNGAAISAVTGNITTTTSEGANLAPNLAVANIGGTLIADVTTTLVFPTVTLPGASTDGLVAYRNNGPSISSGMTYTLTLATGLSSVTFTNLPAGATAAYNLVTGVVTFTGMPATIAIGGVASGDGINGIGVHYPQPAAFTPITSTVATTTSEGANALPNSATTTVIGYQFTDLKVTKTDGLATVSPQQTTVYTVRVLNGGGADIPAGATVTDTPTGLTVQSVACSTVANNRCLTAPSVSQITSGLSLPPLPLGGFFEFLVTARVAAASGNVVNTATTTLPAGFADLDSTTNSATDIDQVVSGTKTQIGIAKAASALQAQANGHFTTTFTMNIVNYGTEALNSVRVADPLATASGGSFGVFAAAPASAGQYTITGLTASGLTANSSYNGGSDLLAASGALTVGGSATVAFTLDFIPAAGAASFTNQATATGTGATTTTVTTDLSTDGTNPDPAGTGNPGGASTPTKVGIPRLGLAKAASAPVSNGNGTYDVTFSMVVANTGGLALTNVQVTDTLANFGTPSTGTLPAPGQYVITAAPAVSNQTGGAALVASSAFTGAGATAGLLATGGSMPAGATASIVFTIRFFPRYAGACVNSAVVSGVADVTTLSTASSNGTIPDPNKVSPTTIECHGQNIGAALQVTTPVQNGARRFLIPYRALVRNMDTLSTATNVQLSDDIKGTFPTAQSIIIVAPAASAAASLSAGARGALNAAAAAGTNFAVTTCSGTVLTFAPTAFDGQLQKNMLAGNQNLLPREQCVFNFTVQVDFGTNPIPLVVQDMQTVATTALTPGGAVIATDSSTNGPDPDPDANGTPRNNSIPTPVSFTVTSALTVTKTTPMTNVVKGQIVPYTITVSNPTGSSADATDIRDMMPAGFAYRKGTASIDGTPREPTIAGRTLDWTGVAVAAQATHVVRLMLVVGAGATPGLYTNDAAAFDGIGGAASPVASATVRVIPDATFDCSDIIGKVFDDKNGNGVQDPGERGLPGVRVVSARGWLITADANGKFHIACAAIPDADRGSNFVLKLDERTLPTGYVLTTENPRSVRLTDGKMAELNFGATLRKLVRLDLSASAFDTGSRNLRDEWLAKLDGVHDAAGDGPFMLRVVFTAASSDEPLARERLNGVISLIRERWRDKPWYKTMQIEQSLVYARKPEGGR